MLHIAASTWPGEHFYMSDKDFTPTQAPDHTGARLLIAAMLLLNTSPPLSRHLKKLAWALCIEHWSQEQPHVGLRPTACAAAQVQTIGFMSHLRSKKIAGPFLVLGPLSTLSNWVSEVEGWCPDMPVVLYHGDRLQRTQLRSRHMPTGEIRVYA